MFFRLVFREFQVNIPERIPGNMTGVLQNYFYRKRLLYNMEIPSSHKKIKVTQVRINLVSLLIVLNYLCYTLIDLCKVCSVFSGTNLLVSWQDDITVILLHLCNVFIFSVFMHCLQ